MVRCLVGEQNWFRALVWLLFTVGGLGLTHCGAAPWASPELPNSQEEKCHDGEQNGLQTDIDCGGPTCEACAIDSNCAKDRDCRSGNCAEGICQPPPPATYVAFSDSTIHRVNVDTGSASAVYSEPHGFSGIQAIAMGPNGALFTGDNSGLVIKLNPQKKSYSIVWKYTGKTTTGLVPSNSEVIDLDVNKRGEVFVAFEGQELLKLTPEGQKGWSYKDIDEKIEAVFAADNSRSYLATEGGLIAVGPEGQKLWSYMDELWIEDVVVDSDGFVYMADFNAVVWKLPPTGDGVVWRYTEHDENATGMETLALGADGYIYSADDSGNVHKIDTTNGTTEWTYGGHPERVQGLSADHSSYVYSGARNQIHKLDAETGERVWSYGDPSADSEVHGISTVPQGN